MHVGRRVEARALRAVDGVLWATLGHERRSEVELLEVHGPDVVSATPLEVVSGNVRDAVPLPTLGWALGTWGERWGAATGVWWRDAVRDHPPATLRFDQLEGWHQWRGSSQQERLERRRARGRAPTVDLDVLLLSPLVTDDTVWIVGEALAPQHRVETVPAMYDVRPGYFLGGPTPQTRLVFVGWRHRFAFVVAVDRARGRLRGASTFGLGDVLTEARRPVLRAAEASEGIGLLALGDRHLARWRVDPRGSVEGLPPTPLRGVERGGDGALWDDRSGLRWWTEGRGASRTLYLERQEWD